MEIWGFQYPNKFWFSTHFSISQNFQSIYVELNLSRTLIWKIFMEIWDFNQFLNKFCSKFFYRKRKPSFIRFFLFLIFLDQNRPNHDKNLLSIGSSRRNTTVPQWWLLLCKGSGRPLVLGLRRLIHAIIVAATTENLLSNRIDYSRPELVQGVPDEPRCEIGDLTCAWNDCVTILDLSLFLRFFL